MDQIDEPRFVVWLSTEKGRVGNFKVLDLVESKVTPQWGSAVVAHSARLPGMKNGFVIGFHVPERMRIDLAGLPVVIETQHISAAYGAYNFLFHLMVPFRMRRAPRGDCHGK
jgi:hypothetical protein